MNSSNSSWCKSGDLNAEASSVEDVASWLWNDLLASNPFGNYGVLVPWEEFVHCFLFCDPVKCTVSDNMRF